MKTLRFIAWAALSLFCIVLMVTGCCAALAMLPAGLAHLVSCAVIVLCMCSLAGLDARYAPPTPPCSRTTTRTS